MALKITIVWSSFYFSSGASYQAEVLFSGRLRKHWESNAPKPSLGWGSRRCSTQSPSTSGARLGLAHGGWSIVRRRNGHRGAGRDEPGECVCHNEGHDIQQSIVNGLRWPTAHKPGEGLALPQLLISFFWDEVVTGVRGVGSTLAHVLAMYFLYVATSRHRKKNSPHLREWLKAWQTIV